MMQATRAGQAPIHAPTTKPLKAVPISRTMRPVPTGPAVATPASPNRSWLALPVISGLCCLGLVLFLIAATIVLSLIPLYVSRKTVEPTIQRVLLVRDFPLPSDSNIPIGDFNEAQNRALENDLQQQLNNNSATRGARINVINATAINTNSGKRKRQQGTANAVRTTFELEAPRTAVNSLPSAASGLAVSANGAQTIESETTTTTTTTIVTTPSNGTRTLVRRSLEQGGAPAGFVYIDTHAIAADKGDVTSVSFYVDRSCASATVEFGAFELINRDQTKNTADFRLITRSGPLKLATVNDLKPFMSLITIRLCSGKATADINSGGCQGHQFPVLRHQYIGIRSGSCRLGFAPVTVNPVHRVTLRTAGEQDPFQTSYDQLHYIPANYTILHTVTIDTSNTRQSNLDIPNTIGSINRPRVLFIGSFPSRQCGLAKFLEDLTDSYAGPHSVVAVDEDTPMARARTYPEKVIFRLNQNERDAYYKVAEMVNSEAFDVLNVQHEYGLFGGVAGEYIISMLGAVRKPIITTMHTIIPEPSTMYMSVTRALCASSTRIIVMSELGRRLLIDLYGVDETRISLVLHGVPDMPFAQSSKAGKEKLGFDPNVPIMTTFGLLHRNKNIEFALKALRAVVETEPSVLYLIIGQTHPAVQTFEGESYRHELESNVTALGLTKNVELIDKYVSDSELLEYLAATDIYLTPYAREDQYVSGTLSWAVGLGKAVISTPYMHAKELLADGRGFLVPFEDPAALSSMIIQVLEDDKLRNEARRRAYQHGRYMTWNSVAIHIQAIARELILNASK